MIKAILFDVIGTTVSEAGDVVVDSLEDAFKSQGLKVIRTVLSKNRGKDKRQMIREMLETGLQPLNLVEPIYESFAFNIKKSIARFSEEEQTSAIFNYLKKRGIKIGIGTGLSTDLFNMIYQHLGWDNYEFDYVGISDQIGKSRPDPAMVFDMMKKVGLECEHFLKVGDTLADIQEGKNAGVKTAVILSGTQSEADLRAAQPDYVIGSLLELIAIVDSFEKTT